MPDRKHRYEWQPIIDGKKTGLKIHKPRFGDLFENYELKSIVATIASVSIIIGTILVLFGASPVSNNKNNLVKVTIESGSGSKQIGQQLADKKIIRSAFVFDTYVSLMHKSSKLQAGTYRLSPSDNLFQIVGHLESGSTDKFSVTFYPGATLTDNTRRDSAKKQDVATMLKNAGYSEGEIKNALNYKYSGPLFAGKPASSDLEGYVYGDTYAFNGGATARDVLQRAFDEFYAVLEKNDLIDKFNERGLTLYQAITLASIIQREDSDAAAQPQIAQVFYSRLNIGMVLGSDVTYIYAANKLGVEPTPSLNSPYNTRINKGLPPGPIASPGLSALKAVANPAPGDYLYFLAGDDGKTYFAKTYEEHENNISNHCQVGCSTSS